MWHGGSVGPCPAPGSDTSSFATPSPALLLLLLLLLCAICLQSSHHVITPVQALHHHARGPRTRLQEEVSRSIAQTLLVPPAAHWNGAQFHHVPRIHEFLRQWWCQCMAMRMRFRVNACAFE
eukprot:COSAG02_NODE_756_length_17532_cov_5.673550_1_plen_122_part_00